MLITVFQSHYQGIPGGIPGFSLEPIPPGDDLTIEAGPPGQSSKHREIIGTTRVIVPDALSPELLREDSGEIVLLLSGLSVERRVDARELMSLGLRQVEGIRIE